MFVLRKICEKMSIYSLLIYLFIYLFILLIISFIQLFYPLKGYHRTRPVITSRVRVFYFCDSVAYTF